MRKLPKRIKGFRSRIINEIIDYLEATQPLGTPTIRYEQRSNGIAAHVKNDDAILDPYPFEWYWTDKKKIKVKIGKVIAHIYEGITVFDLSYSEDETPTTTELELPDSAVARTQIVYIKSVFTKNPSLVCTIEQALDAAPADETVANVDYFYWPLYQFTTQGDGSTGANAVYQLDKILHRGYVHLWPHWLNTTTA